MLFRDGVPFTELKRENAKDDFVLEFEEFKTKYAEYVERRSAYHLVAVNPRGKNKLQGLMEPAQRANIEMKVTKVGEDGIVHEYMWAKGMPRVVNGEKKFNATQYYWLWSGSAYLDGKDVEIAFFLEKYSDQFGKIFKKNDPEANAKAELDKRKNLSFLDYTLSNNEAVCDNRDVLDAIAKEFGVNCDKSQSDYEVANGIRDEIATDLEKNIIIFKELVGALVSEGSDALGDSGVASAEKAWDMGYNPLKDLLGVTGVISHVDLVKQYCEKYEVEYKEKDSN